jgi:hypothetical protein
LKVENRSQTLDKELTKYWTKNESWKFKELGKVSILVMPP